LIDDPIFHRTERIVPFQFEIDEKIVAGIDPIQPHQWRWVVGAGYQLGYVGVDPQSMVCPFASRSLFQRFVLAHFSVAPNRLQKSEQIPERMNTRIGIMAPIQLCLRVLSLNTFSMIYLFFNSCPAPFHIIPPPFMEVVQDKTNGMEADCYQRCLFPIAGNEPGNSAQNNDAD